MVQNTEHFLHTVDFYHIFRMRYLSDPTVGVFGDLKMMWGIPDLKEPAPDVAVVPNLNNKDQKRESFSVALEGTRPCLVIEIVSPNYPGDDTDKVKIYARAGVQEYFIVDPNLNLRVPYYSIKGYRLIGGKYRPIKPNNKGELLSQTTKVLFCVSEDKRDVILRDGITKERLLTTAETELARQEAEFRAQQAEARAQAEFQARQEAEARLREFEKRVRELEAKQ